MTKRVERPGVREGYDRWSTTYDATPNPLVALDRRVTLGALDPRPGERVLDAGCGTGSYLSRLCEAQSRPVGLDFSRGMLRVAQQTAPGAALAQADLNREFPVQRGCFDAVLSALVSEHLRDLRQFFAETFSALRRGGRFIFSAFHPQLALEGIEDAALTLLGLFSGAMLVIGVVLVGYWQSLDPGSFLNWFAAHAGRVGGVMIPLGVTATLATVASAAVTWRAGRSARAWSLVSAVLAILVVVVYLAVHAPRNAAFAARATPPEHVGAELATWARWHWIRVLLGLAAFWAQLLAVRSYLPSNTRRRPTGRAGG